MTKETVVIYGPFPFPVGAASANRVYGIARAIVEAGWHVLVIGKGDCRRQDLQQNGTYVIDGIQYGSIYNQNEPKVSILVKLLSGGMSYQRIWTRQGVSNPYAIISYGYYSGNYWVARKALKSSGKFIVDIVEWFSPSQFKAGIFALPYIDNQLGIKSYEHLRNSIVVSKTLESHYAQTIPNIIRIPPTINTQAIPQGVIRRPAGKLKLIYAGSPGKKDYLQTVIQAIGALSAVERKCIQFNIYGIDQYSLQNFLAMTGTSVNSSHLEGVVIAHGHVTRDIVLEALQDSDFMVLLRPQMRHTNAGFPSKVPESLAAGTPVMLNYTSDLSMYIRDGYEGIVVDDCSSEAMVTALRRALALSRGELNAMRLNARKCAEEHFDYRNYAQPLRTFLQNAK